MNLDRKKIIVREIRHWRSSKLLPEQYCDFLLNLYVDTDKQQEEERSLSAATIVSLPWKLWFGIAICVSLCLVAVIQYQSFPAPLQLGLALLFILSCYGLGAIWRNTKRMWAYILMGFGSISLLFISVYLLNLYQLDDPFWVVCVTLACALIWLMIGVFFRMLIFQFSGFVGVILVYGWLIQRMIGELSWFELQLTWVPLAAIFIWLGWLLSSRSRSVAALLLLISLVLWFAPEGFALLSDTQVSVMTNQVSIVTKILLSTLFLYLFRNKWSGWIAV